jgi:hypothetical protein
MLGAIEQLMRLHPASQFGRWERGRADLELFEELERRHVPPEPEHEIERRESTWMLGEVAAATAMLVLFIGVLTVIARWSAEAPNAAQPAAPMAVSDMADLH